MTTDGRDRIVDHLSVSRLLRLKKKKKKKSRRAAPGREKTPSQTDLSSNGRQCSARNCLSPCRVESWSPFDLRRGFRKRRSPIVFGYCSRGIGGNRRCQANSVVRRTCRSGLRVSRIMIDELVAGPIEPEDLQASLDPEWTKQRCLVVDEASQSSRGDRRRGYRSDERNRSDRRRDGCPRINGTFD